MNAKPSKQTRANGQAKEDLAHQIEELARAIDKLRKTADTGPYTKGKVKDELQNAPRLKERIDGPS